MRTAAIFSDRMVLQREKPIKVWGDGKDGRTVIVTLGDKEFVMNAGDSIYFNPSIPHGQRCGGDVKARFLTVIAE